LGTDLRKLWKGTFAGGILTNDRVGEQKKGSGACQPWTEKGTRKEWNRNAANRPQQGLKKKYKQGRYGEKEGVFPIPDGTASSNRPRNPRAKRCQKTRKNTEKRYGTLSVEERGEKTGESQTRQSGPHGSAKTPNLLGSKGKTTGSKVLEGIS